MGYTTMEAAIRAGVTYRRADRYAFLGLVTDQPAPGSGQPRNWGDPDIFRLAVLGRLADMGMDVDDLRALPEKLESDGFLVYANGEFSWVMEPADLIEHFGDDGTARIVDLIMVLEDLDGNTRH